MKPETAMIVVFSLVIIGEALSEFAARNPGILVAAGIAAFSAMFIYSVKTSRKH